MFSAGIAVLCIEGLKAVAAVWSSVLHDVALATESGLTFVATEVLHVPVSALSLGAFVSKNDLQDRDGHNENRQNFAVLSDGEERLRRNRNGVR